MKVQQLIFILLAFTSPAAAIENWPQHIVTDDMREAADLERDLYISNGTLTHLRAQVYSATGDYLNYGKYVSHSESDRLRRDSAGLPQSLVPVDFEGGKEWQYVPGTLANYALAAYGRYLSGSGSLEAFFAAANQLKQLVDTDGALRNNYRFRHYTQPREYRIGWISGMDQGLALSVFYRAYKTAGDSKYLEAGERVLSFLQVPYPEGPMNTLTDLDPSLSKYIWFDEYLADPNVFTLNGYMFTLLGLYDWSQTGSEQARELFERGVVSLELMLPYFDLGSFTAYDLSFITSPPYLLPQTPHFGSGYHGVHIAQLEALYSVTNNATLKMYADKWLRYVTPASEIRLDPSSFEH